MTRICRLLWLVLILAFLVVPPVLADDYLVYSEAGIPLDSTIWLWCGEDPSEMGLCPFFSERLANCDNPEGSRHLNIPSNTWAGFGIFYVDDQAPPQNTLREDLSAFADGDIRFFASSPTHDFEVGFQCDDGSGAGIVGHTLQNVLANYGAGLSFDWQEVVIPVVDFYNSGAGPLSCFGGTNGGAACATGGDCTSGICNNQNFLNCLSGVSASFTSTGAGNPTQFRIDDVRWRTPNSHAGASSVTVAGRELLVDGQPFVVNGVAYTPHSIGENFAGGLRDRPELYAIDFPAIAAMGANTIRIYSSFLTTAMLDAAWANGLYVIPTFGIDPVQFECDAGRTQMQARLEEMIQEWKDHPAILLWMLGNEVAPGQPQAEVCNTGTCTVSGGACANDGACTSGSCSIATTQTCNPSGANTCPQAPIEVCIPETCAKGWYPQLDALAATAGVADPSHPTGTSNADVGDIGIAACSDDAALANLDLWGANLYRGCTFSTAFSNYRSASGKPLLVTEFGSDAWNSTLGGGVGAEDPAMQSNCLTSLLTEAQGALVTEDPANGVSSGQILFSWMDEWWKAFNDGASCSDTYWDKHDPCEAWTQLGYPDPSIQEEFWGVARRDTYCSDMTTPCLTDADCPGAPGTCSVSTGVSCRLDSECPGSCSIATTTACTVDSDCPGICSGGNPTSCQSDGDCVGINVCIFGNDRCVFEPCDLAACIEVPDETQRVTRSAYDTVASFWGPGNALGAVRNLNVDSHDAGTGDTTVSFDPGPGSTDHTLYYGPLSSVSSYGYTTAVSGLGSSGSSSVTLPAGSLFWVVVGRNAGAEGCYGKNSACNERPPFSGAAVPQAPDRTCSIPPLCP